MSPTVLRCLAIPLGLLAFALHLVLTFWVEPLTTDLSFGTGLLVIVGAAIIAVTIPFGIFWLLSGGYRRRPQGFVPKDGHFTAPASPLYAGSQAMLWMFLSGNFVFAEWQPNGNRLGLATSHLARPATLIGVGIFWLGALAFLLVQRPQLDLDSHGLIIRRLRRSIVIAWDELAPGGPLPPRSRRVRQMRLYLRAPLVGGYLASEDVPIGWLHVDPAFLARSIRHYVEHPDDREAIGTEQGLEQLRAAGLDDVAALQVG